MTKRNQNNRQNNTHTNETPQTGDSNAAPETGTVVALRSAKGTRSNIFEMEDVPASEATAHKLQIQQEAKQQLAEAADLWNGSTEQQEEAAEIAGKAALLLSTARVSGEISPDEVTATLGDIFGFKAKADGSPSKTPKGQGEAIRKRIVRLAAASDFLDSGGAKDGFFKGLSPEQTATVKLQDGRTIEVTPKDVYDMTFKGEIGFWAGYEAFAAIKRAAQVPVPLAFNANRIAEIAKTLEKDGSAQQFIHNPALRKAYAGLWKIIRVVGEEAAELANAA